MVKAEHQEVEEIEEQVEVPTQIEDDISHLEITLLQVDVLGSLDSRSTRLRSI